MHGAQQDQQQKTTSFHRKKLRQKMTETQKTQHLNHEVLDRSQFDKKVSLIALLIPASNSSLFMKQLKGHLLAMKKLRAVHTVPTELSHLFLTTSSTSSTSTVDAYRMVLLDPRYQSWSDLPSSVTQFLEGHGLTESNPLVTRFSIVIGYAQMTTEEVLKALMLPALSSSGTTTGTTTLEIPSAFEQVGHVAHLNLREEFLPYKHLIGQVILDKSPMIETVVNKVGMIDSVFREAKLELLAGKDDLNVELKEHGMRFRLNFAEVYWNSRLAHEHRRVLKHVKKEHVVCDMMAGIGPFAIPAAKNIGCRVHANDLNPKSYEYMCINAKLNKVNHLVSCYNMDGRDFVRMLVDKGVQFDHVLMNLPGSAVEFLDVFVNLFPASYVGRLPMIHVYTFIKGDTRTESQKMVEDAKRVVEKYLSITDPSTIDYTEVVDVRDVAPKKNMYCVSFKLPESVGLKKDSTSIEDNDTQSSTTAKRKLELEATNSDDNDCHKKIKI